jgi:hypothetical protein
LSEQVEKCYLKERLPTEMVSTVDYSGKNIDELKQALKDKAKEFRVIYLY